MAKYPHNSAQNCKKPRSLEETQGRTNSSAVIKRQWLKADELTQVSELLSKRLNPGHLLCFRLALATGRRFRELADISWDNFNARSGTLNFSGSKLVLYPKLAKELSALREQAEHPDQRILNIQYKNFFRVLKCCFVQAGIDQKNCFRLLRQTFIREHFQVYQSKKLLKVQLGLNSLRRLPKTLFQSKQTAINLFPQVA